jgi:hypothetical protein
MKALPIDRALAIYDTIANRSELKGTRERLSQHLWKVFLEGEHDPHHLTVHGLTFGSPSIQRATVTFVRLSSNACRGARQAVGSVRRGAATGHGHGITAARWPARQSFGCLH